MKRAALIFVVFIASACVATPTPQATSVTTRPYILSAADNPYAPQPGDSSQRVTGIVLISINLVERSDLTPPRVELTLSVSLPRVCDQLRATVSEPDAHFQIYVEIYGIERQNAKCDNVFQQVEATIVLGRYSTGTYTVWVNDGRIGDFVMY